MTFLDWACLAFLIIPMVIGIILEARAKRDEQGEYCLLFIPGFGHVILLAVLVFGVIGSLIVFVDWLVSKIFYK